MKIKKPKVKNLCRDIKKIYNNKKIYIYIV